jgi:hypothetical protein
MCAAGIAWYMVANHVSRPIDNEIPTWFSIILLFAFIITILDGIMDHILNMPLGTILCAIVIWNQAKTMPMSGIVSIPLLCGMVLLITVAIQRIDSAEYVTVYNIKESEPIVSYIMVEGFQRQTFGGLIIWTIYVSGLASALLFFVLGRSINPLTDDLTANIAVLLVGLTLACGSVMGRVTASQMRFSDMASRLKRSFWICPGVSPEILDAFLENLYISRSRRTRLSFLVLLFVFVAGGIVLSYTVGSRWLHYGPLGLLLSFSAMSVWAFGRWQSLRAWLGEWAARRRSGLSRPRRLWLDSLRMESPSAPLLPIELLFSPTVREVLKDRLQIKDRELTLDDLASNWSEILRMVRSKEFEVLMRPDTTEPLVRVLWYSIVVPQLVVGAIVALVQVALLLTVPDLATRADIRVAVLVPAVFADIALMIDAGLYDVFVRCAIASRTGVIAQLRKFLE